MNKEFTLRCERIQPGIPNMNNRVYPRSILLKMVGQVQEKCKIGTFLGRLGTSAATKIRIRDASHLVRSVWLDADGRLSANCEVLETEKGCELGELIEKIGLDQLEIIPFGIGSLRDGIIGEDYRLASLDIVQKLKEADE